MSETTHYILGSVAGPVAGPHLYPMMVREFHAVIGKETRKQALEIWGGKLDVLVACVGGGSNAMGLFHEFVNDKDTWSKKAQPFILAALHRGSI
ncbi:hypothetical protein Q3G72_013990 [Acer saccharum]|nr:hypothetical protein Q3G72_013990 [Acer saccharum]